MLLKWVGPNILGSFKDHPFAVNWFTSNKIAVNSDKFQAIIPDKEKSDLNNKQLVIDS